MTMDLTGEARARLDAHLDAVEAALLKGGRPREHRRGVVDDLETQIMDMLARQSDVPSAADVDAVLAGLDPPGAYGEAFGSAVVAPPVTPLSGGVVKPRYSRVAIAGFVCILVSLIPLLLSIAMAIYIAAHATPRAPSIPVGFGDIDRDPMSGAPSRNVMHEVRAPAPVRARSWMGQAVCVVFVLSPLALTGTVLGWVAFGQIRGSGGKLVGKGLALFDGLFYPIVMPLLLAVFIA